MHNMFVLWDYTAKHKRKSIPCVTKLTERNLLLSKDVAQSAGAVEYTDCTSAEA